MFNTFDRLPKFTQAKNPGIKDMPQNSLAIKPKTNFTLIELLVVIAIIATLAAILLPVFARHTPTATTPANYGGWLNDANFSSNHFQGGNSLFCDGHVKWRKASSICTSDFGLGTPNNRPACGLENQPNTLGTYNATALF